MRRIAGLLGVVLGLAAGAGPARAQTAAVGDPFAFDVRVAPDGTSLSFRGRCDTNDELADNALDLGGATLFASTTPAGPLLAAVPLPPPPVGYEGGYCPGFSLFGPPPGTYYVVMVYGAVSAPTAPAGAWQPVVIGSRCTTAPPLPPGLAAGMPSIGGNALNLAFDGNLNGCATSRIDLEVGTTPGGREIGVFPLPGFGIFAPNVPPGTYYARGRGVNAAGAGRPSVEVPLQVGPSQCTLRPAAMFNAVGTANGHTVTVTWGDSNVPGSNAPTFLEVAVFDPTSGIVVDHLVLPPLSQLVVPGLASGAYRIGLAYGNACGRSPMAAAQYIDFTVP